MKKRAGIVDLVGQYKVIVLIGPGGVGKTTCSIATAIAAAMAGKSVGLLSIDPAKRLASALGISLGNELQRIKLGDNHGGSAAHGGFVEAAMLDQKAVFDSMVTKHAPNKLAADKILKHKLYIAASSKLSGPLEYMALAKLQEMVESKKYDLVVLDTPPDTQALDFLKRPNLLAGFMENRVMSWLVKPFYFASRLGVGKLFSTGEKLMGGVAKVTGFKALSMLAEFLVLIQDVIEGFHRSAERIVKILRQDKTAFFLVTTPSAAAARSATNLASQVVEMGYGLDLVLFNRCLPEGLVQAMLHVGLDTDVAARGLRSMKPNKSGGNSRLPTPRPKSDETSTVSTIPQNIGRETATFGSELISIQDSLVDKISKRLNGQENILRSVADEISELRNAPVHHVRVFEQEYDLHTCDSIYRFSKDFSKADVHNG